MAPIKPTADLVVDLLSHMGVLVDAVQGGGQRPAD